MYSLSCNGLCGFLVIIKFIQLYLVICTRGHQILFTEKVLQLSKIIKVWNKSYISKVSFVFRLNIGVISIQSLISLNMFKLIFHFVMYYVNERLVPLSFLIKKTVFCLFNTHHRKLSGKANPNFSCSKYKKILLNSYVTWPRE